MMNVNRSVSIGAGAAAAAFAGTLTIGALPLLAGLAVACTLFGGLGYVAFATQSRRFEDRSRPVYRPVYVRARNVHRRVRPFED